MGRRRKAPKEKSRKKVIVKLLERQHAGKTTAPYRIMDELIESNHSHLSDAKIAIAWRLGWKADPDGRVKLGQAKKGSDLDRELHDHDFVLLLNHEAWNRADFSEAQQRALIDHELCHCQVSKDSNGESTVDENGRTVYRLRKHDLEEFREIVARHGLWKDDLREFAETAMEHSDRPLLDKQAKGKAKADKESANGSVPAGATGTTTPAGIRRFDPDAVPAAG